MLGLAKGVCLFSPCRMTSIPTSNHSTFMQTQQRFQWRNEISGRFARKFFHSEPNSSRFFVNSSNFYQSAEMVSWYIVSILLQAQLNWWIAWFEGSWNGKLACHRHSVIFVWMVEKTPNLLTFCTFNFTTFTRFFSGASPIGDPRCPAMQR